MLNSFRSLFGLQDVICSCQCSMVTTISKAIYYICSPIMIFIYIFLYYMFWLIKSYDDDKKFVVVYNRGVKSFCPYFIMLLTVSIAKYIFNMPRPISKYALDSFPSGHMAAITTLYYIIRPKKILYKCIFIVTIILVGVSRVILKDHYIMDVIFGYLFGLLSYYLSGLAMRPYLHICRKIMPIAKMVISKIGNKVVKNLFS